MKKKTKILLKKSVYLDSFVSVVKNKTTRIGDVGRSMIEMLGVLAVIGVLSIVALNGYRAAISRHKANETIHDVMIRATNVPMIDEEYKTRTNGYEWQFAGLPQEGKQGSFYQMQTVPSELTGYVYKVEIQNVPVDVCKKILQMNPTDVDLIKVGDKTFTGSNDEICESGALEVSSLFIRSAYAAKMTTMSFYFDDDWTQKNSNADSCTPCTECQIQQGITAATGCPNCEAKACAVSCATPFENGTLDSCGCPTACACTLTCTEPCTQLNSENCTCEPIEGCTVCKTCEEVGCSGGDCSNICIQDDNGCATGCTNGGSCPEGTELAESGGKCACMSTLCGENSNGQSGAQSSSVCCKGTYMKGACGDSDNPLKHIWVGDTFDKGNGSSSYCCCSENESKACCEATNKVWCNNECKCEQTEACVNGDCCPKANVCGTGDTQTCCTADETCEDGVCKGAGCLEEQHECTLGTDTWCCNVGEQCGATKDSCETCTVSNASNNQTFCQACGWTWGVVDHYINYGGTTSDTYACMGDAYCKAKYDASAHWVQASSGSITTYSCLSASICQGLYPPGNGATCSNNYAGGTIYGVSYPAGTYYGCNAGICINPGKR